MGFKKLLQMLFIVIFVTQNIPCFALEEASSCLAARSSVGSLAKRLEALTDVFIRYLKSYDGDDSYKDAPDLYANGIKSSVESHRDLSGLAERLLKELESESDERFNLTLVNLIIALQHCLPDEYLGGDNARITFAQYEKLWRIYGKWSEWCARDLKGVFNCDTNTMLSSVFTRVMPNILGNVLKCEGITISDDPDKSRARELAKEMARGVLESSGAGIESDEPRLRSIFANKGHLSEYLPPEVYKRALEEAKPSLLCDLNGGENASASKDSAIDFLLGSQDNARDFMRAATLLRVQYPYTISSKDPRPPLQYARENGIVFQLAPGLFMTPVTESFRRHLVFATMDGKPNGKIKFAFEVKIPGEYDGKKHVRADTCWEVAEKLRGINPDYCVKPLRKIRKDANWTGAFDLYGKKVPYDEENPLEIIVYDYDYTAEDGEIKAEDGKRLEFYTPQMIQTLADELQVSSYSLRENVANQIMEILAATHYIGYIGHNNDGTDMHTGNFRLIIDRKAQSLKDKVKIKYVGDFIEFRQFNKTDGHFSNEANEDMGHLMKGVSSVPGLSEVLGQYYFGGPEINFIGAYEAAIRRLTETGAGLPANIGHTEVTSVTRQENARSSDASYSATADGERIWIAGKSETFDKEAARKNLGEPSEPSAKETVDEVFNAIGYYDNTFTYFTLVNDLFGFPCVKESFVALHESVADIPLAVWHELSEYLIKKSRMSVSLEGNVLKVKVRQKSIDIALEEEAMAIANRGPVNPHYLLWAMQRQLWPEDDRKLSAVIGVCQLINKRFPSYGRDEKAMLFSLAKRLCLAGVVTSENMADFVRAFAPVAESYYDKKDIALLRKYCDLVTGLASAGVLTNGNIAQLEELAKPSRIYETLKTATDNFDHLFPALEISCDMFYEEANYLRMLERARKDPSIPGTVRARVGTEFDFRVRSFSGMAGKQGLKVQLTELTEGVATRGLLVNTDSRKNVNVCVAFIDWSGTINFIDKHQLRKLFEKLRKSNIEINILSEGSPTQILAELDLLGLSDYVSAVIGVNYSGLIRGLISDTIYIHGTDKRSFVSYYLRKMNRIHRSSHGQIGALIIDNEYKNYLDDDRVINLGVIMDKATDVKTAIRRGYKVFDERPNPSLPDYCIPCLEDYGAFEYLMDRVLCAGATEPFSSASVADLDREDVFSEEEELDTAV